MKDSVKLIFKILFAVVVLASLFLLTEKEMLRVADVEVVADNSLDVEFLFQQIKPSVEETMEFAAGKYIWEIGIKDILSRLKSDSRIEDVELHRRLPNKLQLVVKPYKPLLAMMGLRGQLHPVANDASLLPSVDSFEVPDLPVLRGLVFHKEKSLRHDALKLLTTLPEEAKLSAESISEIKYSKQYGFVLHLVNYPAEVRLGKKNFARKTKRVEKVLNYLFSKDLKARVIDARFSKKVVVKLRNPL